MNYFALALPAMLALSTTTHAALLSALIGGAPLVEGNATYSNFKLGGTAPLAEQINVTASTTSAGASVIAFTLVGGAVWSSPLDASQITFNAAFSTPITAVGLDFVATGSPTGFAFVGETVSYLHNGNKVDTNLQLFTDGIGTLPDTFSQVLPLPHETSALSVVKSIDTASSSGPATITSVSNTYFPSPSGTIPEPASLTLLAAGLTSLLKRRRNR